MNDERVVLKMFILKGNVATINLRVLGLKLDVFLTLKSIRIAYIFRLTHCNRIWIVLQYDITQFLKGKNQQLDAFYRSFDLQRSKVQLVVRKVNAPMSLSVKTAQQ